MIYKKPKAEIKFIYFDVGGVLVLDYSKTNKWNDMLSDLNIPENKKTEFENLFDSYEKNICIGEDINIFVKEAKEKLDIKFPKNYNMTADFVSSFERNESILELVIKLKNKFKLGLLTAQYPNMLNMILDKQLIPRDIWDVVIDSSIEKVTKPDLEIYQIAENKAKLNSEEILFIDNKSSLRIILFKYPTLSEFFLN